MDGQAAKRKDHVAFVVLMVYTHPSPPTVRFPPQRGLIAAPFSPRAIIVMMGSGLLRTSSHPR